MCLSYFSKVYKTLCKCLSDHNQQQRRARGRGRGRGIGGRGGRGQPATGRKQEERRRGNGVARRDPEWVWNEIQEGQFRPQNAPFQGVERIKERIPNNPSALDYFNLYFTNRIIDHMVTETNKYADQILEQQRDNIRPHSMLHQWVSTTCNECVHF